MSAGDVDHPAVQLLLLRDSVDTTCGFLRAVGRKDATDAYRSFHDRLPSQWFACYTGVFSSRPQVGLRVECIPSRDLQRAYGDDISLLATHLRQVGLLDPSDGMLKRCQLLARAPFQLEFQFDVGSDGIAGQTLGASVRFAPPSSSTGYLPFEEDGAAGDLMAQVEGWGLADDRWRLLDQTSFAMRLKRGDMSAVLISYPAFLKLRCRAGQPLDAKAYLIAGIKQRARPWIEGLPHVASFACGMKPADAAPRPRARGAQRNVRYRTV